MLADGELFFLTLYVDDILICATNTELLVVLKDKSTKNFEMKDLDEVSQYLEMKITWEDGFFKVDKKHHIEDILKIRHSDSTQRQEIVQHVEGARLEAHQD